MLLERTIVVELGERERKDGAAARRFPVSVSSEFPVPRRDWASGEVYEEVLSHARGAIDLSRAPLPVLEGHDRSRPNIGIVTNLRADGGRLRGELVLGESQRAQELAADIGAGIVTGLSIGYQINAQERDAKAKRITATRWMPFEVSIVSVPADNTVGVGRSHPMEQQDATATTTTTTAERREPAAAAPAPAAPAPEVLAERERVRFIQEATQRHQLGADFARALVDRNVPLEQAREAILERLAVRSDAIVTENHVRVGEYPRGSIRSGDDYADDFRAAASDALLLRAGIRLAKPHAGAHDVSASVYDLARTCLSRAGKPASGLFGGEVRGPQLLKRAMTTPDFPAILSDSMHKSIRNGYETEPASHREWVRTVPVPDFRLQHRPILGSAPALEQVGEHEEYPSGSMSDEEAKYSVSKFGKIVSLSWETLQNDNLGAFLRVQPAMGQAARRLEADKVYGLFALNSGAGPAMQDAINLFDAQHANVTSSGTLDVTLLGAARALLRKQVMLNGGYLSLVPRYWIVPAERESAAEVIMANATRRMVTEKAEPEWIASLTLVVEPRLQNSACYLAADNGQIDTVELGVLEGDGGDGLGGIFGGGPGPIIEENREFIKDVVSWKVKHVFGTAAVDFRGLVKMPVT